MVMLLIADASIVGNSRGDFLSLVISRVSNVRPEGGNSKNRKQSLGFLVRVEFSMFGV